MPVRAFFVSGFCPRCKRKIWRH